MAMLLNRATFNRVAEITGYQHVQYHAGKPDPRRGDRDLVKFLVYDGPEIEPTRGHFVWVNEDFNVVEVEPHVYSLADGDKPIRRVTTPY
jgi:hypothetical protein